MMQSERKTSNWLAGLATAAIVALFTCLMVGYFGPTYEGTDQNGYLCSARRIALTGSAAKHTTNPLEYTYTIRYSEALLALPVVAMVAWRYCQLRELRDKAKALTARKPIALAASATGLTNSQGHR